MKSLAERALEYHRQPRPGKTSIRLTKPAATADDLTLAYSPGVASPCLEIEKNPLNAYEYTNKGNLVGIVTNGSAVLGLGAIGALAAKPVMEGKAMLFKQFAELDVFDIEIAAPTTESFIETVASISPTFGAINLEDIRAPECFFIEQRLRELCNIPVLHDDQHGTAVVVCAALLNALELQGKDPAKARMLFIGSGAAGIACARLAQRFFGLMRRQILLLDSRGVVSSDREDLPNYKLSFARDTKIRTIEEAVKWADVVVGVARGDMISREMVRKMRPSPVILALSNPVPEIMPPKALSARDDLIIATGRSDFPNQVNNSVCFPYLFRAALDARVPAFTEAMLFAAVRAIAELAREPVPEAVLRASNAEKLSFGPEYILPKQFDPRLRERVVPAVIAAATERTASKRREGELSFLGL